MNSFSNVSVLSCVYSCNKKHSNNIQICNCRRVHIKHIHRYYSTQISTARQWNYYTEWTPDLRQLVKAANIAITSSSHTTSDATCDYLTNGTLEIERSKHVAKNNCTVQNGELSYCQLGT